MAPTISFDHFVGQTGSVRSERAVFTGKTVPEAGGWLSKTECLSRKEVKTEAM